MKYFLQLFFLLLIQEGLVSVTRESFCACSTCHPLSGACLGKSELRLTDCLNMTIAAD